MANLRIIKSFSLPDRCVRSSGCEVNITGSRTVYEIPDSGIQRLGLKRVSEHCKTCSASFQRAHFFRETILGSTGLLSFLKTASTLPLKVASMTRKSRCETRTLKESFLALKFICSSANLLDKFRIN